jgi:hypothetical protein
MTTTPAEDQLVDAIADAARTAFSRLFTEHQKHHFYYCALTTTGEGHAPVISAWSVEALDAAVKEASEEAEIREELKWSYADSPFYCFGEEHFEPVIRMFNERPIPNHSSLGDWQIEVNLRLRAMEKAMARLDLEGLFGSGNQRLGIVINAEIMPPDHTNMERALRLNPLASLTDWLVEAAEPE